MDPETGYDAVANVGVKDGRIAVITTDSINGNATIDATGHVVAPGFIDIHAHGQNIGDYRMQAMQGVTTMLELESGVLPISAWYDAQAKKKLPDQLRRGICLDLRPDRHLHGHPARGDGRLLPGRSEPQRLEDGDRDAGAAGEDPGPGRSRVSIRVPWASASMRATPRATARRSTTRWRSWPPNVASPPSPTCAMPAMQSPRARSKPSRS